ncbi:hypothetical protein [Paenibacillus apis]|uniref:Uncharacterized protein n=1 Tax=Paenibacillus apis TaxID=1792174 RepID=A0A920CI74_9BACL|nr:hypothetical protein [Paenibacillus apis]GIO41291.1 hypothetical protein J41TS4_10490 [Paenibacillus apis]
MSNHKLAQLLAQKSDQLIQGCIKVAHDGTKLFTPDGIASYDALWVRDFAYMVEYASEFLQPEDIRAAVDFVIGGRREDGWLPDRIYADGLGVYAAGVVEKPVGEANLDNTPFLAYVVYFYLQSLDEAEARQLFGKWAGALDQGMSLIPLSMEGLVYNDPAKPHSPYGFTDTIGKTGELFMESLLFWRACRFLQELHEKYGQSAVAKSYREQAAAIERSIFKLYDPSRKGFYAATGECKQLDIWGIAYLLYIGFPAGDIREDLLTFLHDNYEAYAYKGQIRHLLQGEYWERLLIDVPHEEYQNGAYWATASGWVIWCLAQKDGKLAAQALKDVADSFVNDGIFECLNEGYSKLDSFVVSATNVHGAYQRLVQEQAQSFIQAVDELEQL